EHLPPLGHSSNLFRFQDQRYYKTYTGIYKLGAQLGDLALDTTLTQLVFAGDQAPTSIIIPDREQQRMWYFTRNGIKYVDRSAMSGSWKVNNIPMPGILSSNLGVRGFENISRISDNRYLIGSSNGYVSLDLDKVSQTSDRIEINEILYGDYRSVTLLAPREPGGEFDYAHNNLVFQYGVPEYDKYTEVRYQYRLEGLYNDWSPWTQTPQASFMNLPFGEYVFQVRAMAGNGPTENTASYSFVVERPWTLSNVVLACYALILALL